MVRVCVRGVGNAEVDQGSWGHTEVTVGLWECNTAVLAVSNFLNENINSDFSYSTTSMTS